MFFFNNRYFRGGSSTITWCRWRTTSSRCGFCRASSRCARTSCATSCRVSRTTCWSRARRRWSRRRTRPSASSWLTRTHRCAAAAAASPVVHPPPEASPPDPGPRRWPQQVLFRACFQFHAAFLYCFSTWNRTSCSLWDGLISWETTSSLDKTVKKVSSWRSFRGRIGWSHGQRRFRRRRRRRWRNGRRCADAERRDTDQVRPGRQSDHVPPRADGDVCRPHVALHVRQQRALRPAVGHRALSAQGTTALHPPRRNHLR